MLTSSAGGNQKLLHSFAQNHPPPTIVTPSIKRISEAVTVLLNENVELREAVLSFDKGALWKLTLGVGALLGRKVNPESVARTVRKYKTGR